MLLSIVTTLASGLVPAIWLAKGEALPSLRIGSAGAGAGPGMTWFRRALVAGEVALSMTLLLVAGLLVKSFWRLSHVDPGFRPEHVLSLSVSVPIATYPEGDQIPFHRELTARVAALPGVVSVGSTNILPLAGNYSCDGFQVDARPKPAGEYPCAETRSITPDYFRAMGVRLIGGRFFSDRDIEGTRRIVIINEAMARQYWPGEDPVGQTLTYASRGQNVSRVIVGVVSSVRHFGLDQHEVPEFYTPHAQQPSYHTMNLVVRAQGDPLLLTGSIREIVASLDKDVPISNVRTLDDVVATSIAGPRLRTVLLGAFALLALVLAVGGLYGVISYAVGQRTREIGIRMALGAQAHQVVASTMREGLVPGLAGIVAGLCGAVLTGRLLASLLFGITPTDAVTFVALPILLLAVALAATYVPARRATRIDPVSALRAE
jgi:putative ABC transport system permease protein